MSGEASGAEAYLYVISCGPERARIGVAGDARKRLRELQVGSPVELKLAHAQHYPDRRDAEAVAEELYRYLASRCLRGSWYRLTLADARAALARPATLEAPAHAQARARAAAEAAAHEDPPAPRRGGRARARTQRQLAYERRRRQERTRKQKRAAKLLGQGMTQEQAAFELAVTSRTLRNWKSAPPFRRELERQHKHAARQPTRHPPAAPRRPPGELQQTAGAADPLRSPSIGHHDGLPDLPRHARRSRRSARPLRGTQAQQPAQLALTTTTTPNAATSRPPSAAPANDATTAVPDNPQPSNVSPFRQNATSEAYAPGLKA